MSFFTISRLKTIICLSLSICCTSQLFSFSVPEIIINPDATVLTMRDCLTPGDLIYVESGVSPGAGYYGEFKIIVNDLNVVYDECELANDLGTLSCKTDFDYEGLAFSCPDINAGGCLGDIVNHGTWIPYVICNKDICYEVNNK